MTPLASALEAYFAVSTYRRRILRKLRLSNNAQLVRYAAEMIEA